ncbi:MAG: Abi family protein [bacterium]
MKNNTYSKKAISITQQLKNLEEKELVIDIENAEFYLERINFFRLACYLSSFRDFKASYKCYHKGTKLSDVLQLYYFDKDLRLLLFSLIQTIEVAVRSKMINTLSKLNSHWFMCSDLAQHKSKFEYNLASISREVERSGEDYIKSYYFTYNEPKFPPAWKTLEVLSFGQLSKLYANFIECDEKKSIAYYFNLPNHKVFLSWLKTIAVLRNYCAHHSRVWNRNYQDIPNIPKNIKGAWITEPIENRRKLYMGLCCAKYMLNTIYPNNNLTTQLEELFAKYPTVKLHPMGFTPNWKNEALWK